MNDHAYDISYLLDSDSVDASELVSTLKKASPPAKPTVTLALVQDTMARELLQAAAVHDALVQQYLRISGVASAERNT
ncbi:MAG: hypothetical protein OQK79_06035 [Rhodanobacter sp.]|jgi:hypothetical protein|nr:hypothetical protein [Rhodanobacter sp.]